MSKRIDFDSLVAAVIQQEGLSALRPVVEKELLHYDILFCLSEAGLLKELIFQGEPRSDYVTTQIVLVRIWILLVGRGFAPQISQK